jgi:hypothetical protein
MYGLAVTVPPTAPITAAELRARLRLNDPAEDADLDEFLASAVELFEHDTGRPVMATTYRQYLSRWPYGPLAPAAAGAPWPPGAWEIAPVLFGVPGSGWPTGRIVLGRGGVTAIAGVYRYLADGTTTEALTGWSADLVTPPPRIQLAAAPAAVASASGIPVSPVGYVEFTAGWPNKAAVPPFLLTALKLLAGHWYENREAYRVGQLTELPDGWCRAVTRYKTGLTGDWGQ